MEIEVIHDPDKKEFYFIVDKMKGYLLYEEIRPGLVELYHTYVPPALRNQGAAEEMVLKAVEYARKNYKAIIPTCSYAIDFFEKHPEYKDILKKQ